MKYLAALLAISAAAVSAQVVYNNTTGTFSCPGAAANGAFCAGTSLQTNIIIRCYNGTGQPGNCNDNLAGQPPRGVNFSPCYETSPTAGDAACSKNCIVYGTNGTFTLPASLCTPNNPPVTSGGTTTALPTNGTMTSQPPPVTTVSISTLPNGGVTSITIVTSATNVPVGPTGTGSTGPIFTGAAVKNVVGGALGVAGVVAAFVL